MGFFDLEEHIARRNTFLLNERLEDHKAKHSSRGEINRKRISQVKSFVYRTPWERAYPITGPDDALVSYASDKVADALHITVPEAAALLQFVMEQQNMPMETPPKYKEKVDQRIQEEQERWKKQIRAFVDKFPSAVLIEPTE